VVRTVLRAGDGVRATHDHAGRRRRCATPRRCVFAVGLRPLTFGPAGRLIATACVIALGPWSVFGGISFANPFFIWYLGAYAIAATLVLRHVWARVAVPPASREPSSDKPSLLIRRYPRLASPIEPQRFAVVGGLALVVIAILATAWLSGDTHTGYALVFLGVLLGAGTLIAWLAGI
jgi:hypothetical protein